VVLAEVTGAFATRDQALNAMTALGVVFSPIDREAALDAGEAWQQYRARGGTLTMGASQWLWATTQSRT
jgi:hypothetical protein